MIKGKIIHRICWDEFDDKINPGTQMIEKVQDLIEALRQFDPLTEVTGTYDGLIGHVKVYKAANGQVMIDVDGGLYKVQWQKLRCEVCGCEVLGAPYKDKPVCYKHWKTFKE